MTIIEAILLGIVQGLTEFLPVSSSGHFVLFQKLLGFKEPMLEFDIIVHLGTLLAVFIYFKNDFLKMLAEITGAVSALTKPGRTISSLKSSYPHAFIAFFVVLATCPTIGIALLFKDFFESLFESVLAVGMAWFVMGLVLIVSQRFQGGKRDLTGIKILDALIIGVFQGVAIIPGISRAGSTILAGMACGIEKKEAARFSFLLSVPAILGAAVLKLKSGLNLLSSQSAVLTAGFLTSAVIGYFAIVLLMRLTERGKFHIFGYYCLILSVLTIIYAVSA